MYLHRNAKLGLAGRLALVSAIEGGMIAEGGRGRLQRLAGDGAPLVASLAARRASEARQSLRCLLDRSSRPHRSPRQLAPELAGADLRLPARRPAGGRGWSPARPASRTRPSGRCSGGPGSRGRRGRRREPANSYEWPCPGDLLHMDASRYARFQRPGHRVTGDRSQRSRNWMRPETRVGYDFAHAIVDDHSRLAYVELHADERAATVTGFLERALAFFAGARDRRQAADDRQRLRLRQEPLAARAARRAAASAT